RDPLVVRHHEHTADARDPPRRLDAALDQGFCSPARAFQLDQRLSRIARGFVARRDQDLDVHRDAGQSWMWSTPTGFDPSTTNKAVIRCSSNSRSASSTRASAAMVFGSRVMNFAALWSRP